MTLIMENQTRLESWNNYCDDFVNHLRSSKAVLALLGAGLSASSGISTYQGSGSTWQGHLVRDLATKSRFERDPVLVWEYYRHRQAEILSVVPNAGHFALAGLATIKPDFLTITQNVDDLSQRARHPPELLVPIHGSLLDLHCTNTFCNYFHHHNSHDPHLHPQPPPPTPSCPLCTSLLRPSITRFGDPLPPSHLSTVDSWFSAHPTIDLMLVIGCACTVSPAADYIDKAKEKGARIAVFNVEFGRQALCLGQEDWFFEGDAGVMVPLLLGKVVG
ncbi:DHS-like NAD/FAD-binding domain-containing protein [Aureobasidium pullulans]|uniref:DHS-like NAD/FAD-binding domain-containing protein n=1 Tax=Aureobasidium pullulans TaxID=5580 RepID=A0A4S9F778_AURPU|nr:DHS-like NAD/FAD-binding domain-containing protein [Aureobasidium pullulans]